MMAIRTKLTTKGFEEYLEKIAAAGMNVDLAADEALAAGGEVLLAGMQRRAPVGQSPDDPHPGNLKSKLAKSEPEQDGNFHSIEVGLLKGTDADTARYGNAQEFGTSSMAAQPYVRPALDSDMGKARSAMRSVFKRWEVL